MATSTNPLQRPQISVGAQGPGAELIAPQTNVALQLASSLSGLSKEAGTAFQNLAASKAQTAKEQAQKDAISTNGAAFADAVREGKIRPAQNPWYVQAYATESAAIRAKGALSELQTESQTWDTQHDPSAFQAQWNKAVGDLGAEYSGKDANAGFLAAANQVSQQVLATNQAKAAASVEKERVDNLGALTADSILTHYRAAGGSLSPEQAVASMEASHQQWIGTGGDEAGWRNIAIKSITAAAYTTKDSHLLDLLMVPAVNGGQALYNYPGVADQVESDRYRINQAAEYEPLQKAQIEGNKRKALADQAVTDLYDAHGEDILAGRFDQAKLAAELHDKGYTPQVVALAFGSLQRQVSDIAGLQKAQFEMHSNDPSQAIAVNGLYLKGIKGGYSAAYEQEVVQAVLSRTISGDDGQKFIRDALGASRQMQSEGRAEASANRAAVAAERAANAGHSVAVAGVLRTEADNITSLVVQQVSAIPGNAGLFEGAQNFEVETTKQSILGAMQAWVATHPDDSTGALKAGRAAAAAKVRSYIAAPSAAAPSGGRGTNPRK